MKRIFVLFLIVFLCTGYYGICLAEEQTEPADAPPEALVLRWINEARANPWAEVERLGLNATEIRRRAGDVVAAQWDAGLPPLTWDDRLTTAGAAHVQDMVDRLYYSHISPEGFGPRNRMEIAGYNATFVGESMGAVAFANVFPQEEAMRFIYESLIRSALQQGAEGSPLLDPLLKDAGIHLGGGGIFLNDSYYNVYILIADLGSPSRATPDSAEIWGHVYRDENGNGAYDSGEGLPGITLRMSGWRFGFSPVALYSKEAGSGREGGYSFKVSPSTYDIEVFSEDGTLLEKVEVQAQHVGLSVRSDIPIPLDFSQ